MKPTSNALSFLPNSLNQVNFLQVNFPLLKVLKPQQGPSGEPSEAGERRFERPRRSREGGVGGGRASARSFPDASTAGASCLVRPGSSALGGAAPGTPPERAGRRLPRPWAARRPRSVSARAQRPSPGCGRRKRPGPGAARGPSPPAQPPGARGQEGGGADVPRPTEASLRRSGRKAGGRGERRRREEERGGRAAPQPGRAAFPAACAASWSPSRARPADGNRVPGPCARFCAGVAGLSPPAPRRLVLRALHQPDR